MTLSPFAKQSALAQETAERWLFLLEVIPEPGKQTLRFVNDNEPITSNGDTYRPLIFELHLAIDDESHLPEVSLAVDNVGRDLIDIIRTSKQSPIFTVRLILASKPDDYETEVTGLSLLEVSYDAFTMQGTLYLDDLLNIRYPADVISWSTGYNSAFRK